MLIAGLVLIALGVMMAGAAVIPWSFDFAIAITPRWHHVIFPPPEWLALVLMVIGVATMGASLQSR